MISTHVLDTSKGFPAAGVNVSLEKETSDGWQIIDQGQTNQDGRYVFAMPNPSTGVFRIVFNLKSYFEDQKTPFFFLQAPVIFQIHDISRRYHIPLLLNPFGYSTYRGS